MIRHRESTMLDNCAENCLRFSKDEWRVGQQAPIGIQA